VQAARVHSETLSGFGEATTTVLEPVEMTAGLRYQHDDVEMDRHHNVHAPAQGQTRPVVPPFHLETRSSAWLPQLTLAYRVRPFLQAYLTAPRGYRPAGFSWFVDDARDAPFAPQHEWSEEIGVKGSWLEHRLAADLALFYIVPHDFQVVQRFGFTGFQVLNAPQVTSRGLDASVNAELWPGLDLSAVVGYVDAHYDRFHAAGSKRPLDGNPLQFVPPYNFAVALDYRHPTGVVARVEYRGNGGYPYTEENTVGQGAYELLDARIGWAGEHFGIAVFGKNLTNVTYLPFGFPGGPGGQFIVAPGAPRTFGVQVTGTF
jgi:iron complex outermembrane receptor protein